MELHLSTQLDAYQQFAMRPQDATPAAVLALFGEDMLFAEYRSMLLRKDVREVCLRLVEQFHLCVPSSMPGIPLSLACALSLSSSIASGSEPVAQARGVASQFDAALRYRVSRQASRNWELWDPCCGGVYAWAKQYDMTVRVSRRPVFSDQDSADHAARLVLIEQVFVGTPWESAVPLLIEEYACA